MVDLRSEPSVPLIIEDVTTTPKSNLNLEKIITSIIIGIWVLRNLNGSSIPNS